MPPSPGRSRSGIISPVTRSDVTRSDVFTDPWARTWCEVLDRDETYRQAASGWEGALALVLEGDEELGPARDRAVYLDLHRGRCRRGRAATDEDLETAPFVLRGPSATWKRVLEGGLDPIFALMSGKLRLSRGSVARLVPYTRAAKRMVEVARGLETAYPEGWDMP